MLAVLSVAGLAAFYHYFGAYMKASPRFQVRAIEIEGADFLDKETIVERSGITGADNVFFFDPDRARSRVEAMPYVKSCSIAVSFPDTVLLAVEERRPVASLLIHSRAYEIDDEGVVLREYAAGELPRGPYITVSNGTPPISAGSRVEDPGVAHALSIWRACRAKGIDRMATLSEFAVAGAEDVRLYGDEFMYEVRWGRGNVNRQAQHLAAFWRHVGIRGVCDAYLDLRFGRDIACK